MHSKQTKSDWNKLKKYVVILIILDGGSLKYILVMVT